MNKIPIEKRIPFYRSKLVFLFLILLTLLLYAFMTTKTIQIYLYIGFHQLYGSVLKIFSLPKHLYFIKSLDNCVSCTNMKFNANKFELLQQPMEKMENNRK